MTCAINLVLLILPIALATQSAHLYRAFFDEGNLTQLPFLRLLCDSAANGAYVKEE
jgi:hypothetical protein